MRVILLLPILAFGLVHSEESFSGTCPADFTKVAGKCIHIGDLDYTYDQAYEECESLGAKLLEPKTDFVYDQIVYHLGQDFYWIGISDQETEGKFVYNSSVSQMHINSAMNKWRPFHPIKTADNADDCVRINNKGAVADRGWEDVPCNNLGKALCQANENEHCFDEGIAYTTFFRGSPSKRNCVILCEASEDCIWYRYHTTTRSCTLMKTKPGGIYQGNREIETGFKNTPNVLNPGFILADTVIKTRSAKMCQKTCKQTHGCVSFSWLVNGICVHDSRPVTGKEPSMIKNWSGPATCSDK